FEVLRQSVKNGSPGIKDTTDSIAFDNKDCVLIRNCDFNVNQKNKPPSGKFHVAKSLKYMVNTASNASCLS
ncbi:MAG: hypothetical protein ACI8VW_002193, partial [bacterium]